MEDQQILLAAGLQLVHCNTLTRQVILCDSRDRTTLNHTLRDSVAHAHHTYELGQRNICAVDTQLTRLSARKMKALNIVERLSEAGQLAVRNHMLSTV